MSVVDRVRRPEYTGENRCIPCTVVNTILALAFAGVVGVAALQAAGTPVAAGAGGIVLLGSLAAIYLRGYLVPYTPTLTKRYFPDSVLALFDKVEEPGTAAGVDDTAAAEAGAEAEGHRTEVDPETVLVEAGAIEECVDYDDLCLAEDFRAAWYDRMGAVDDVGPEDALAAFGMDAEDCTIEEHGGAYLLRQGNTRLAQWESGAALTADVAASRVFADRYDGWATIAPGGRGQVLQGLRVFADACPDCGGRVELGEETVESCCRSFDVVAVSCADCDARLFEERIDGAAV